MNLTIREIVKGPSEVAKFQQEWARQLATAEEIANRHEQGLGTVLLADEVGMGKTYVAMANIANHVFQTGENDRRVLLVVPPNNVLARKWEQEIRTFNEKYLTEKFRKTRGKVLRPMVVSDYWDLIRNLHNFENQEIPRVSNAMLQCFALAVWQWNDQRREKRKWRKDWSAVGKMHRFSLEYLDFCTMYSPRAIEYFLDEKFSDNPHEMTRMVNELNNGDLGQGYLKTLFKDFGSRQDFFEANVFIMGMSTLRRTRVDRGDSTLLSTYIASSLLKGRRTDTKLAALKKLVRYSSCFVPEGMAACGNPHQQWFVGLGGIDLWGMKEAVWNEIDSLENWEDLVDRILNGEKLDALFKELQANVISRKLSKSGIGLAVIDEVHNWKNGSNGATEFQKRYAPAIPKKLIMSATPFQLHQDELGRVFDFAAAPGDKSMEVVHSLLGENGIAKECLDASQRFLDAWKTVGQADILRLQVALESSNGVQGAIRVLRCEPELSPPLGLLLDCVERYHRAITTLQVDLKKIIIRHTKNRDKRHFHAGREYSVSGTPDYAKIRRTLYSVPGFGEPDNALLNFLAMRAHQLVRRDVQASGREPSAHLLGGITSSNKAFKDSNQDLLKSDQISPSTKDYLTLFEGALDKNPHPKVSATVQRAFANFQRGYKTLIFVERLGTQKEILKSLEELINKKIFTTGGFEQARKDREAILKDHQAVELFWSRSYLVTVNAATRSQVKRHLLEQKPRLIEAIQQNRKDLDSRLNQRRVFKLLDLAMLQEIERWLLEQGGGLNGEPPQEEAQRRDAQLRKICNLFSSDVDALREYVRLKHDDQSVEIDGDDPKDGEQELNDAPENNFDAMVEQILEAPSIWHSTVSASAFHLDLWQLMASEKNQQGNEERSDALNLSAGALLDLGQGLRKVLLRLDTLQGIERRGGESIADAAIRMLGDETREIHPTSWDRTWAFVKALIDAEGTINRKAARSSMRKSLWKGVFLRDERIASELNGSTDSETRVNLCAAFNSPLLPDILICTSIGSEGIDLHRHCADVIHHDLPWNPAKIEQRTGRIDRVGSLAETRFDNNHFRLNIGIPFLAHNYEKFQYELLLERAQKFEVLLGKPEFPTDVEEEVVDGNGNENVIETADQCAEEKVDKVIHLPDAVVDYLKMDLSIHPSKPIERL